MTPTSLLAPKAFQDSNFNSRRLHIMLIKMPSLTSALDLPIFLTAPSLLNLYSSRLLVPLKKEELQEGISGEGVFER